MVWPVDLNRLFKRGKKLVDDRGGTDALKKDAEEVREIMKGGGGVGDKAKRAAQALKDPGAPGGEREPHRGEHKPPAAEPPRSRP
jgi:hypothetical protein